MAQPVDSKKGSKADHLEAVRKRGKRWAKTIEKAPPIPWQFSYIWGWYCEISTGERIPFSEIESWATLKRIGLKPYEAETLSKLSIEHQIAIHEKHDAGRSTAPNKDRDKGRKRGG